MSALPLAAGLGIVAWALWSRARESGSIAPRLGAQPVRAGVPYLFVVRLEADDETATGVLESKGVEMLQLAPATRAPFWSKPGELYSTRAASFKAVPQGNGSVTLGEPFYGIGRLEQLVRLDGQPFASEASDV